MAKLGALGFEGALLSWLGSFLSNRVQRVRVGEYLSDIISVLSGVPQGSHCGPILFNLYINDLNDVFSFCSVSFFADDLKMYRRVLSCSDLGDFQREVDSFATWCRINKLYLNMDKCFSITFSRSNLTEDFPIFIDDTRIASVNKIKDLGIILDSKLSFVDHFSYVTSKSLKTLGFVNRSMKHFSLQSFKTVYSSFVRSTLEYASVVFNPYYKVHIQSLESVQNKFLRCCAYRMGLVWGEYSYNEVLSSINMETLEIRRRNVDLLFLFNIINGNVSSAFLTESVRLNVNTYRTRNPLIFAEKTHSCNYVIYSCINRLHQLGNKHCQLVDFFSNNLNKFRNSLKHL